MNPMSSEENLSVEDVAALDAFYSEELPEDCELVRRGKKAIEDFPAGKTRPFP